MNLCSLYAGDLDVLLLHSFRRLWYIRNKLNRTNVPKKDVNACEDFIEIITSSLVIATVMTTLQLKSANDFSSADGVLPWAKTVWMMSDNERREIIFVDRYMTVLYT